MSQVTLNVQGMSCGHCVNSIEGNVGNLNGVESVKVNLDQGKVDVTFDPSTVSLKDITDVIEDQGYNVGEKSSQGKSCHCC
ncbi:copper chaperone CopZ [Cytobacillus kochii]|uniref:copper chaperone CopZ n=1 Tax=Cytobacillus kochii TaxID=859143 RepID=UPI0025A19BB2|nr:copper chaperone CopZ [Cytobacillus kochii]MDM5205367.1 copper chaperone CopZ [Cytobacillus kochii]